MKELDQKHRHIKEKVQMMYELSKIAEKSLAIARKECEHPETEICNYMWAPGHINPNTKICSVCGEVLGHDEIE